MGSDIASYTHLYTRLRLLRNTSAFSSLWVLYTANLSFIRFVILFRFKVNYIAKMPCQIIKNLIFYYILQQYSLNINQQNLQSNRLFNSQLIPLLVVFLEPFRCSLALFNLLVLSNYIIRSTFFKKKIPFYTQHVYILIS